MLFLEEKKTNFSPYCIQNNNNKLIKSEENNGLSMSKKLSDPGGKTYTPLRV